MQSRENGNINIFSKKNAKKEQNTAITAYLINNHGLFLL